MKKEWIPTSLAAKMLDYTPQHFRRKFDGIIPKMQILRGNVKWLRSAVEKLMPQEAGTSGT